MPYFGKAPFFVEGMGRLWVFGTARDSTVADVFADSTYLGHVMFPCYNPYGFRSVTGHWIAMNCMLDDDAPLSFELQLYRIVEPVRSDSGKPTLYRCGWMRSQSLTGAAALNPPDR